MLHLAADASDAERYRLAMAVKSVPAIGTFGNVDVIGKSSRLSYMGSSHLASTLHAAAILLKIDGGWDWFIQLSALDYPLITPDGISISSSFLFLKMLATACLFSPLSVFALLG